MTMDNDMRGLGIAASGKIPVSENTEISEPEVKECVWCDRAFALFGICMGLVFLYISVDILMGSRVSTALSGSRGEDEDD